MPDSRVTNQPQGSNTEGPNSAVTPKQGSDNVTVKEQGSKIENKGGLNVISRLNKSTHHTTG